MDQISGLLPGSRTGRPPGSCDRTAGSAAAYRLRSASYLSCTDLWSSFRPANPAPFAGCLKHRTEAV